MRIKMDKHIEEIMNSIDLSAQAPQYEPMRQYYYLKACREIVKKKIRGIKQTFIFMCCNIWMPDECERFGKITWYS